MNLQSIKNVVEILNYKNYCAAKQRLSMIGGTRLQPTFNGEKITDHELEAMKYFDNTPDNSDILLRKAITQKNNYK